MPQKLLILFCLAPTFFCLSQQKSIDKLLKVYNTRSVPYISVQELKMKSEDYIILDTRKKEEFEVSHLPNAIWVGENPDESKLKKHLLSPKSIVLYCTVGIRSETFGEKLERQTQKPISNLYGGIFAWINAGYKLLDSQENPTNRVHTFSKIWEDYLSTGIAVH